MRQKILSGAMALCLAVPALAQPSANHSIITFDPAAVGSSIYVLPTGGGFAFTSARTLAGAVVDATIHLKVRDSSSFAVPGWPATDIWLESTSGHLAACFQGTIADHDTDSAGDTRWELPLFAGGWSRDCAAAPLHEEIIVWVNGNPVPTTVPLRFNSADLNGDLVVNLLDVSDFAAMFVGGYCYAADFNFDGILNLVDISYLSIGIGTVCP